MEIKEYKCPNCNGVVKFDSSTQNMKCPYCDAEFEIASLAEYQKEIALPEKDVINIDLSKTSSVWDNLGDLKTASCPSCGAELVGDENTIATVCPCCGNTQIVQKQVEGLLKPEYVIPFQLEKKAAVEALKSFYSGKRLLPNLFKEENRVNSIQGLYVPFWLYDARAEGHITYKATNTKAWSDSNFNYTKTDHYMVVREGGLGFEKIPVDASERMDNDYMDAIEPFDYSKLKGFLTAYLSGYIAEKYDVDANASKERAVNRIKQSVESQFAKSVQGYSSVIKQRSTVNVESGKASYSLFPVWILNTKYQNENFQFIMNGQSGLITGRLPIDKGKVFRYMSLFTVCIGAALTVIIQLLRIFL
jgi:predicted RNA-binding Zn-ribbon protein involved in translation (DUF1610 family)